MTNSMQIRIGKAGLLTTVQDMGRWGYRSQGVPVSGVMDTLSARIANLLLGNDTGAAVIEFTYGGATFHTETDLLFAYAGDGATMKTANGTLPADRPIFLPANTDVQLVNNPAGSRTYLAVAGGWDVADVLGSKSTYTDAAFGGFNGRALQADDRLAAAPLPASAKRLYNQLKGATINFPAWGVARWLFGPQNPKTVRVVPANEMNWFTGQSVVDFLSAPYTVSTESNRMGYRLGGPRLRRSITRELLSTAVCAGTIQVTGEGSPVLLMADCQTTGGYPRIAYVAAVDLPVCAQWKPGDRAQFSEISHTEAEKHDIHRENQFKKLAAAIATKVGM